MGHAADHPPAGPVAIGPAAGPGEAPACSACIQAEGEEACWQCAALATAAVQYTGGAWTAAPRLTEGCTHPLPIPAHPSQERLGLLGRQHTRAGGFSRGLHSLVGGRHACYQRPPAATPLQRHMADSTAAQSWASLLTGAAPSAKGSAAGTAGDGWAAVKLARPSRTSAIHPPKVAVRIMCRCSG